MASPAFLLSLFVSIPAQDHTIFPVASYQTRSHTCILWHRYVSDWLELIARLRPGWYVKRLWINCRNLFSIKIYFKVWLFLFSKDVIHWLKVTVKAFKCNKFFFSNKCICFEILFTLKYIPRVFSDPGRKSLPSPYIIFFFVNCLSIPQSIHYKRYNKKTIK